MRKIFTYVPSQNLHTREIAILLMCELSKGHLARLQNASKIDGNMREQTDRQTDSRTDGRTVSQADRQTDR